MRKTTLLPDIFHYPLILPEFRGIRCPVLVDRRYKRFLLASERVPNGIAGGWRTSLVVVPPCHIYRTGDMAGKVYYIIIGKDLCRLRSQRAVGMVEMWISARSALFHICCHVAQCRMVYYAERNPSVYACRYHRQGSSLTSALHNYVHFVPLWQLRCEVDGTDKSEIYVLHIIAVAIVYTNERYPLLLLSLNA